MIRRPPRSTRTEHSFPTRRSSDLFVLEFNAGFPQHGPDLVGFLEIARLLCLRPVGNQGFDPYRIEARARIRARSEEHTSELQSLMRTSYAVFCLKKKKIKPVTN